MQRVRVHDTRQMTRHKNQKAIIKRSRARNFNARDPQVSVEHFPWTNDSETWQMFASIRGTFQVNSHGRMQSIRASVLLQIKSIENCGNSCGTTSTMHPPLNSRLFATGSQVIYFLRVMWNAQPEEVEGVGSVRRVVCCSRRKSCNCFRGVVFEVNIHGFVSIGMVSLPWGTLDRVS